MSLQIDVFDNPHRLYEAMREARWLVFPSRFALDSYLLREGETIWGDQPLTAPELWAALAGDLPRPLGEIALSEEVRALLRGPLQQALGKAPLGTLLGHMSRLDAELGREWEAGTEIESELRTLQETLFQRGCLSESAWRSEIARRAVQEDIPPLTLAPLPAPSRQWGELLRNLSLRNDVRALLLLSPSMVEPYLQGAGLGGESWRGYFDREGGFPFEKPGEPDREVRLLRAASPADAAVSLLGEKSVLVSPSPFADWREFIPPLRERSAQLRFRTDISARDTASGSEILNLPKEHWQDFIPENPLPQDVLWLQAFHRERESLRVLPPGNIFPESVYTPRVWRGSGPPLLAVGEAALARPREIVFWGVEVQRYPLPEDPSPFFSEDLLRAHPQLGGKDKRPTFASALLAAEESITLLCGEDADPSAFFLEAERAWGPAKTWQSEEVTESERFRQLARSRARTPFLQTLRTRKNPPEPPQGREYSVTELEAFLRCPLGWFVRYRLRPQEPPSPERELGILLHSALEEASALQDRSDALEGLLGEHWGEWGERLQKVLLLYDASWPASETFLEVPLQMTIPFDDEEVVLRGRADRIDIIGERVLVTDWKSGSLPPMKPDNLQGALYPLMAADRLQREPLGFMYVSLRSGERSGLTTEPLLDEVPVGWRSFSGRSLRKAEEAIRGIESGQWQEKGSYCPSWCPHYMLSGTGERS